MIKILALAALVACALAQGGQQGGPPPFLQGAPQAKVNEFEQLLQSGAGLTDAQMDAKVKAWIGQQSPAIQSSFAQFQAQVNGQKAQAEAAHAAAIAKFSPAAKAADAKLAAIANNAGLTQQQKGQQIDALMQSLPKNVQQEIQSAMQG